MEARRRSGDSRAHDPGHLSPLHEGEFGVVQHVAESHVAGQRSPDAHLRRMNFTVRQHKNRLILACIRSVERFSFIKSLWESRQVWCYGLCNPRLLISGPPYRINVLVFLTRKGSLTVERSMDC